MAFLDTLQGLLGQANRNAFPARNFGLLTPEQVEQSQKDAKLATAASLLQASGPSSTPQNPMGNLGAALQVGREQQRAGEFDNLRNRLLKAQIGGETAAAKRDAAEASMLGSGEQPGTSVTAHAMNIITREAANPGSQDPNKVRLALMHLEKPETTVGPAGTTTREGIDASSLLPNSIYSQNDAAGGDSSTFDPAKQTEGDMTRAGAAASLLEREQDIDTVLATYLDFNPATEVGGRFHNLTASPAFRQYENAASQWSTMNVKMKSGVAARPEEMERQRNDFFPEFGDDEATIAFTNIMRYKENIVALRMGTQEVRHPETGEMIAPRISVFESEKEIADMERRIAAEEEKYAAAVAAQRGVTSPIAPDTTDYSGFSIVR